jgi:hypothetical protein
MILSLLAYHAAITASFDFKGGSDQDLVSAFQSATHHSCALLVEPSRHWKAISIPYVKDDAVDLSRLITVKLRVDLGLRVSSNSQAAWPSYMLLADNPMPSGNWGDGEVVRSKEDSKLTLTTKGGAVEVTSLLSDLSKPVKIHWFFERARLVASAEGATEKEFVTVVASAIGAKLVETKDSYSLEFDPTVMRRRAEATSSHLAAQADNVSEREGWMLEGQAMDWATNGELAECYRRISNTTDLSNSLQGALQTAAFHRLAATFPVRGDTNRFAASTIETWSKLEPLIDLSRPCTVVLCAAGHTATRWSSRQPDVTQSITTLMP